MSLLEVDGTCATYGTVAVTHDVSFTVEANEIVALVGANGAGKSSTLMAILGMVRLIAGRIRFAGNDITGLAPHAIVRQGIALSPEGRRVFAATSVHENLMAGAHTLRKADIQERLEQVLTYFPRLRERFRQMAGSLSGGEQQMLAIGRALMSRPKLLMLDEPSLGLAPVMVQRIGELLREIQSREQLAVILAEQNVNWALKLASRGLTIEVGHVKLTGSASELRNNDYVRKAYLGA
ncbi:ABC transporter ATP-binding protein [Reyranella sp. CPCC 100927]|uniref:ABC transporter ATP-binding protein n=1 Tax=Reyranella sp. CPCC 100927 TaxID=2599616 RepID=UPI0011B4EAB5|nr:ABC transporter ATP-binding protein [Reyranella sp. CPCC 100927]TWT15738.1 ABC transporter ATP-binding protein [Reyranella sp. CPCC 100927]